MKKEIILYHPSITFVLSLWGLYSVYRHILEQPSLVLTYFLTELVVFPFVLWIKGHTSRNQELYVLLATDGINSAEEINQRFNKDMYIPTIGIAVFIVSDFIFRLPFISCLLSTMLITLPQNNRIYQLIRAKLENNN